MDNNRQILDLSDCDPIAFEQICRIIDIWKKSGEGMVMSLNSVYRKRIEDAFKKGIKKGLCIGAISGVVGSAIGILIGYFQDKED